MTVTTTETATSGGAAQTEQSIAIIVEHRPEIVLLDDKKRDALFAHIEAEVEAFVPDMTTAKGREECRGLAAKVTRTKTAVDKARLALTEDARAKIKSINESGAVIKERLESLSDRARRPLTEWEEAEEKREAECKAALERLRTAAIIPLGITSDGIRARIAEVESEPMGEDKWLGMLELAQKDRDTALEALRAALERVEQEERDRAELERLRAEAARAEQERIERERKLVEEEEARQLEARLAKVAEERRLDEERRAEEARKAETARDAREAAERATAAEQAAKEAEERARQEEQARAAQQAAEQQRAHDAELAAERAERERLEAEQREREQQAQAEAAAREQLERDAARRTLVKTEAKQAFMTTGMSEDHAQKAVLLIIAGEVPRVILDFAAEPLVKAAPPVPVVGQGDGDMERLV
jgi:colicin import membrane protein